MSSPISVTVANGAPANDAPHDAATENPLPTEDVVGLNHQGSNVSFDAASPVLSTSQKRIFSVGKAP